MNIEKFRITLHIDMDSFYSSVETLHRPSLKGLPVIVGSDPKKGRGVVSTCSYEARKYGVHSAMPITKAYKLCPQAIYLPVNMELYKKTSEKVMKIINSHATKFQQVSVDEAYIELNNDIDNYDKAIDIGYVIKKQILEQEGLTCSVGIAPNKVLSKIASDFNKPNGLTVVKPTDVIKFLHPLNISKLPGIGRKTASILNSMGIKTIGELANYDVQLLISRFGKFGLVIHEMSHGIDNREVKEKEFVKSISKEDTFDKDISDINRIRDVLYNLVEKVHISLLKQNFRFRTVNIRVRYSDFRTYTRSSTLNNATNDVHILKREVMILMKEFMHTGEFRLLGVGVSKLEYIDDMQTCITDFE